MDQRSLHGRRLFGALAIGAMGLTLIILFLSSPTQPASPRPTPGRPLPSAGIATPALPLEPLHDPVTVVDGLFDARADRSVRSPTRDKNQSKLFFAYGSWWGVLHEPLSREARIHRLDWATQAWHDTGVLVDERPFGRADVLFADDHLYVASGGSSASPNHAVRVSVYDYDPSTERWSVEPDFPVTVSASGVESALIERSASGVLWVAYIEQGSLLVTHTVDDLHRWATPFEPNVDDTLVQTDLVGMTVAGDEVLLLWSDQGDEAFYATSYHDGDPDDVWTDATTVISGLEAADNHLNVKALPDGRVFAVIKTSLDTVPNSQPGWDQVLVLVRTDGRWSSQQFAQIRDKHTRPILLLDVEDDHVLVFATAPTTGGGIYMKQSGLDDLRFPVGLGEPVILDDRGPELNDATSTKQPVDASTGVVVLASDDSTGRYFHLAASLGGPAPGRPAGGPPPEGPEPAPPRPVDLVWEPNDSFDIGDPIQPNWQLPPSRAGGTVRYVERGSAGGAVRVVTTGTGELRPCRRFAATSAALVSITADVRLDRQGATDTVLLMARGDGDELGGLRVDDRSRLRVSSLSGREDTEIRIEPGRWYRVSMTFDPASRTFDVALRDAAGTDLLVRSGLGWRAPAATVVDGLCVAASAGSAGLGLTFDEVRVTRLP